MSEITKLIKGNAWLSIASIISRLTSALTLTFLARFIGPQSLGIYNVVTSLAQTVQGFSGLGVEITLQRNGAKHQAAEKDMVSRLFGVSLLLTCTVNSVIGLGVWCLRQPLADYWLKEPSVANWLGLVGIIAGLQPLGSIPLLFLASLQDFRSYAIGSSIGLTISNIVTLLFTWFFGLKGAVGGLVLAGILQIIWSYIIVKPVLQSNGIRLRIDKPWPEILSILRFGLPYYLGTHLLYSLINLPLMGLVSSHSGLASLGYLRAAQSLATLAGFIPLATAPSVISHLSANDSNIEQSQYIKSVHLRSLWTLLLLSTTIICLFLPEIVVKLFGSSYQPSITFSWLFLWASVLTGVSAVLIQYLVADGKTTTIGWVSAIGAFFWVIPAIFLIPRYGLAGFLSGYILSSAVELFLLGLIVFNDFKAEDFSLLRNLAALSAILFIWSSIMFFHDFSSHSTYLFSLVVITASVVFIFSRILHSHEQAIIKKTLCSIFF
jgi:O-antigen/teichoic acid export membrane protein